jgi:hypothetical protein
MNDFLTPDENMNLEHKYSTCYIYGLIVYLELFLYINQVFIRLITFIKNQNTSGTNQEQAIVFRDGKRKLAMYLR